jgi:hypothetical protein
MIFKVFSPKTEKNWLSKCCVLMAKMDIGKENHHFLANVGQTRSK